MPDKSPETYSWITYAWVLGLAALGGIAAFLRKVKDGHARAFNFVEFVGEIFVAAFAGLMSFYFCQWSGFSMMATAVIVGVSGHMGSKSLFLLEHVVSAKLGRAEK